MNLLPRISLEKIPSGYVGTLKTVEHIIDLLKRGAKDFYVRQSAIDILLQRAVTERLLGGDQGSRTSVTPEYGPISVL